jgi:DNA-binding transcriptional LysR family regulator
VIELRLIKHAIALARHRNFARAAESLHLTQPSLSRSIAALEDQLGVQLFDRAKDGVRPTAFGELLLQRGSALLEGEAGFRREIQLLAGLEAGTLCIGAGPFAAEVSVGTAAGKLLAKHPRLNVDIQCAEPEEIAVRVLDGHFDVGICGGAQIPATPRLRFDPLPSHPLYLACRPGHPLAGHRGLTVDQVTRHPFAATMIGGVRGGIAARGGGSGRLDKASRLFRPVAHVNVLSIGRQIARVSDSLLPATAGMIAQDEAEGTLVRLDFHIPELCTDYGILTLADRSPAPAVVAFLDELRVVEAEIAAAEARPRLHAVSSSGKRVPRRHKATA